MFWKYLLFESKLLLLNKKNWLLGLALVLFFPLYYSHYSQLDIVEIREEVTVKAEKFHEVFDYFPASVWQTEEGKEMYANLLEQQGLLFWQKLYLDNDENFDGFFGAGPNFHKFFDTGLK